MAHGHGWRGAYASMNHLALTKNAPPDMHIVDNFLAAPYIGADLAALVPFDRLRIRLGFAATIERNRADRIWKTQPEPGSKCSPHGKGLK